MPRRPSSVGACKRRQSFTFALAANAIVVGLMLAPSANAAETSESYCAGATPSPVIQGQVSANGPERFAIGRVDAYRSNCFSGNQYITVTERLYRWSGSNQVWVLDNTHTDGGWTPSGYYFYKNPFAWNVADGRYFDFSLNIRYEWWRRLSNGSWRQIGYRTRRFIHSGDYSCYGPPNGGDCRVRRIAGSARWGVFLWSF
jgi:hypothetical protein